MSKQSVTRYFCDRCNREIASNSPDPVHRYRLMDGKSYDLCSECNDDLKRFLDGEQIEAVETTPPTDDPIVDPEPDPEPEEPDPTPEEGDTDE